MKQKINSVKLSFSVFTTQPRILKAECLHLSSTSGPRVVTKILCNKKAWFRERTNRTLPALLLGRPPHPGLAADTVTCWSGTSSPACHEAGSSVCPRPIKLLPYTCQGCLGHCHGPLLCSPAAEVLLRFTRHIYQYVRNGFCPLPFVEPF